MIAPLVKWDHSVDWPVVNMREHGSTGAGGISACVSYTIDPAAAESKDKFYLDHKVDGRVLFPFTGHIVLAWNALARIKAMDQNKTQVILHVSLQLCTHRIHVFTAGNVCSPRHDHDEGCALPRCLLAGHRSL
jgi:hypothetical protein